MGYHVRDFAPFFSDLYGEQSVNPTAIPKRLWLLLHEPRVVTFFQGLVWTVWSLTGLAALTIPPQTISHEFGPFLTMVWGILLFGGGLAGLAGCLPGWWWIERSGILATGTGALVYLMVVLNLHATTSGNRLVQAGFILMAVVSLVVRWVRVSGLQTDPTRGVNA